MLRSVFWGLMGCAIFLAFSLGLDQPFFYQVGWKTYTVSEEEKKAMIEVLNFYHKLYTDLYDSEGNPMNLNAFPTSKLLRHEIFKDLYFLQNQDTVLVWDKVNQEVQSFQKIDEATVNVTVKEAWNYVYQEAGSRKPLGEIQGYVQRYRYTLKKEGNVWKVMNWEPVLSWSENRE